MKLGQGFLRRKKKLRGPLGEGRSSGRVSQRDLEAYLAGGGRRGLGLPPDRASLTYNLGAPRREEIMRTTERRFVAAAMTGVEQSNCGFWFMANFKDLGE